MVNDKYEMPGNISFDLRFFFFYHIYSLFFSNISYLDLFSHGFVKLDSFIWSKSHSQLVTAKSNECLYCHGNHNMLYTYSHKEVEPVLTPKYKGH